MRVAVASVMLALEVAQEIFRNREIQFVALAAIAEVGAPGIVRTSFLLPGFRAEVGGGNFFERGEFAIESCAGNFAGDAPEHGAGVILHDIAHENSERRERSRE